MSRHDDDLDDEIADFLERSTEQKIARGIGADDARRLARAEIGSTAAIRDQLRDGRVRARLSTVWQDLAYGARLMRRSPAFTAVAVAVLALGIAVPTAVFSIVNALFLAPIPVPAPESLVLMYRSTAQGLLLPVPAEPLEVLASRASSIATFARRTPIVLNIAADGDAQRTSGESVDAAYFDVIGLAPMMGRPLAGADFDPGATQPPIVVSHDFWQRRLHADTQALGRSINVSIGERDVAYTVVGVMPPRFRGVSDPWTPSQYWIPEPVRGGASRPVVRLAAGVTIDQLRAVVDAATPALKTLAGSEGFRGVAGASRVRIPPQDADALRFPIFRASDVRSPSDPKAPLIQRGILLSLIAVSAVVLLIAIANVSGLLLARGIARIGEIGVRRALGAGSARIVRQWLTESWMLACCGGAIGVGLAWVALHLFRATTLSMYALEVALDWRVLTFATAMCAGSGLVIGLAPALRAIGISVLDALGNGAIGARRTRARVVRLLVIPQIALTMVLVVVAAVHLRALWRVQTEDYGYVTEGVVVMRMNWRATFRADTERYAALLKTPDVLRAVSSAEATKAAAAGQLLLERLRALSGVKDAGIIDRLQLAGGLQAAEVSPTGHEGAVVAHTRFTGVSEGYFGAMGIRIESGRALERGDAETDRAVAVVSRSLAQQLWPDGQGVGRRLSTPARPASMSAESLEVVGIAEDVRPVIGSDAPALYVPAQPFVSRRASGLGLSGIGTFVVRVDGDAGPVIAALRETARAADPAIDVYTAQTIEQLIGEMLYPRRLAATILAGAGTVGMLLATIGLYGLISYSVAQRRREIGIRATLGASPADLVRLIVGEGTRISVWGGVLGAASAIFAVRATARVIAGLPFFDLISLTVVPFVLAVVVIAACLLPARRAARVDPVDVLRGL